MGGGGGGRRTATGAGRFRESDLVGFESLLDEAWVRPLRSDLDSMWYQFDALPLSVNGLLEW